MLRLALAQLDLTVGALAENRKRIADACADAVRAGADLVLAPELAISGYPPEDLLLRPAFLRACRAEAELLAGDVEVPLVVCCPWLDGDRVRNAALVLAGGQIVARYDKRELPNYGVFDEERTFSPGRGSLHIEAPEGALALTVCEDVWLPDAVAEAAALGTDTLALVSGGLVPGSRDIGLARRLIADAIAELVPVAQASGVRLGIEALHPVFAADRCVISRLGEALDLASLFPADAVGVVSTDEKGRLIEQLGGKIWCQSTLGHGADFSFRLPGRKERTNGDRGG